MLIKQIEVSKRACGERKPGGYYLVGGLPTEDPTGFLPRRVRCSCGITFMKPSRNVKKFVPYDMFPELRYDSENIPKIIPHGFTEEEVAWCVTIDVDNYPSPEDWKREAGAQGISRRILAPPKGFKLDESWVFVLHAKVFDRVVKIKGDLLTEEGEKVVKDAGIIAVFKPKAIQYVIRGDETADFLYDLTKKGITPVKVQTVPTIGEDKEIQPYVHSTPNQ